MTRTRKQSARPGRVSSFLPARQRVLNLKAAILSVTVTGILGSGPADAFYEYKVTGVAPSDRLNVREDPSADKVKFLGTIPWNAKGILGTGTTVLVGKARWRQIRYGKIRGWVNGRFLKAVPGRSDISALQILDCGGTEPFWSLKIRGGRAAYNMMGGSKVAYKVAASRRARNHTNITALTLKRAGRREADTAVLIRTDRCSDGMSDMDFPFEMFLVPLGGYPVQGCCSLPR